MHWLILVKEILKRESELADDPGATGIVEAIQSALDSGQRIDEAIANQLALIHDPVLAMFISRLAAMIRIEAGDQPTE